MRPMMSWLPVATDFRADLRTALEFSESNGFVSKGLHLLPGTGLVILKRSNSIGHSAD